MFQRDTQLYNEDEKVQLMATVADDVHRDTANNKTILKNDL